MAEITCPFCDSTKVRPLPPTTPNTLVTWYFCTYCSRLFSKPRPAPVATK